MNEPKRIIDDAGVEAELRDALSYESGRAVGFDVEAGAERFKAALEAGPPPASPDGAGALGLKAKLLIGAGGVVGAALLVYGISTTGPAPEPWPRPPAATELGAPPARAEPAPSSSPILTPPSDATPSAAPQPVTPPGSGSPPAASASAKANLLAEEVQHLAELRRVLARSPAEAVTMADQGHRRFARGMLYQEREAIAVSALSRAGRTGEARSRAERFLARFPTSPLADQVRSAGGISP